MRFKQSFRKYIWFLPVILTTLWLIWKARATAADILEIAVIVPVWLLSLLGLARAFFGENWFPFAEKIPFSVTRIVFWATAVLLVGATVAGSVYTANATGSLDIRYQTEETLRSLRTLLAWVLYYTGLMYMEQWCLRRNCSRKSIRQRQLWGTITVVLTRLIWVSFSCADMWYIPQNLVDSPNRLEDYFLWWFSLCSAAFYIPLWFLAARKTIRLFRNGQWLRLSDRIPRPVATLAALTFAGLTAWQVREIVACREWQTISEAPEHAQAMETAHEGQAFLWALALVYTLLLLRKQKKQRPRKGA